jgi:glycogen synthase kinase 3 beta
MVRSTPALSFEIPPTPLLTSPPELSIAPQLNHQLVPQHGRAGLASRGLDIDNFTPMAKEEMMARLD